MMSRGQSRSKKIPSLDEYSSYYGHIWPSDIIILQTNLLTERSVGLVLSSISLRHRGWQEFESLIGSPEVSAYVQKNLGAYQNRWRVIFYKGLSLDNIRFTPSFNLTAFLLGPIWLNYRRLHWHVFIVYALAIFIIGAEIYLRDAVFVKIIFLIILLSIPGVIAVFGDSWYFIRTYRKVTAARQVYSEETKVLERLKNIGGVKPGSAVWGFIGFLMSFVFFLILGWLLSGYHSTELSLGISALPEPLFQP